MPAHSRQLAACRNFCLRSCFITILMATSLILIIVDTGGRLFVPHRKGIPNESSKNSSAGVSPAVAWASCPRFFRACKKHYHRVPALQYKTCACSHEENQNAELQEIFQERED